MSIAASLQWINQRQQVLLNELMQLSDINSGTFNLPGLKQTRDAFSELFAGTRANLKIEKSAHAQRTDLSGAMVTEEYGDILHFQKRPEAPLQVLLAGHMDTVFPLDHSFQSPALLNAETLHGPGVADMKGGILVMLTALQAFEATNNSQLGWQVILSADEETGSLGSMPLLKQAARQSHLGMIYEPALADGTLAGARKGSGNFTVLVNGKAAHAGRGFEEGRNAILKAAEIARRIAELSDLARGVTANIARISGGTALNVVPDQAVLQFNIRCTTSEQQTTALQDIQHIVDECQQQADYFAVLSGGFTRPPKQLSAANHLLMEWTAECGQVLGSKVNFRDTGGCCDGNNLAAAGLPNIDTLGVCGGQIHTEQEFMLVNSLSERAKLSFLLLEKVAREGERLIELNESDSNSKEETP